MGMDYLTERTIKRPGEKQTFNVVDASSHTQKKQVYTLPQKGVSAHFFERVQHVYLYFFFLFQNVLMQLIDPVAKQLTAIQVGLVI